MNYFQLFNTVYSAPRFTKCSTLLKYCRTTSIIFFIKGFMFN